MSPLWRDQIQVYFAPGRIDYVRTLRGMKPVETPKITITWAKKSKLPAWQAPLHQLDQMLTNNTSNTNSADLSVTLSNHFMRYVTLPPQAEIATPEEVLAYADFRMREIYAERVDDWVLSVSAWDPTRGAICAAITRDLLTQLQQLAERHKIKFKGIEPYLAAVFDHWRLLFDDKQLCFALIESGRICIALLAGGIWHVIRNQKIVHNVADELLIALDQEAIFTGSKQSTEEEVCVFAPEHPGLTLPGDCGWKMVSIQTDKLTTPTYFPQPETTHVKVTPCVT